MHGCCASFQVWAGTKHTLRVSGRFLRVPDCCAAPNKSNKISCLAFFFSFWCWTVLLENCPKTRRISWRYFRAIHSQRAGVCKIKVFKAQNWQFSDTEKMFLRTNLSSKMETRISKIKFDSDFSSKPELAVL